MELQTTKELRNHEKQELLGTLEDLKRQQFNLRMKAVNKQLTNTAEIRKVRRQIARVLTVLNEQIAS